MIRSQFSSSSKLALYAAAATLASLFSGSTSVKASLHWDADPVNYGYLWQYSIPPSLGAEACGPTSTTNAFTFLQNTQGGRIGNQLTGNDYADWLNAAEKLANDYMQTGGSGSAHPGTFPGNLATGMQQYAQHWHEQNPDRVKIQFNGVCFGDKRYDPEHPELGTLPDWVKLLPDKGPTIEQLYEMLAGGAGVVMKMSQQDESSHMVTLAGMDWNDNNDDGIVDRGEGKLFVIDPLDPSSNFENLNQGEPYGADGLQPQKATLTTLDVWQTLAPNPKHPETLISALAIDYWQYQGSQHPPAGEPYGPYNPAQYGNIIESGSPYFVDAAFSMRAAPEPASILLWSSLAIGLTLARRRRSA